MEQFPRLSKREWDVVKLLLQAKSNKLIASALGISDRTVEFHLKNIYTKFQVSSRIELILRLGNATGRVENEKPGISTVAVKSENIENRDGPDLRMGWAAPFRETVSTLDKELEMKNLLTSKQVLVGVITALFTGALWVSILLYSHSLSPNEIKLWSVLLIGILAIIGLLIGLVGKRNSIALRKVFFSAMFGTGLSPFAIIPLMLMVVIPLGKVAEWFGLIDPSTMSADLAAMLAIIAMSALWLVVGIAIGVILLFVTIQKPKQASLQVM